MLGTRTKINKTIEIHKATFDHLKKNTFGNREIAIIITTPILANINWRRKIMYWLLNCLYETVVEADRIMTIPINSKPKVAINKA